MTVAAGEGWDDLVAHAVEQGWTGIEALSGIPGAVGATPIQNVGAYGQDVSQTVSRVRAWDRVDRTQRTFAAPDCGFSYRHSRFKADPGRYVVLDVTFQLGLGDLGAPVRLRRARPHPRRGRGGAGPARGRSARPCSACVAARAWCSTLPTTTPGVPGPSSPTPSWPPTRPPPLPDGAPRWEQPDGTVKSSAAWLIEHAGFAKGHVSAAAGDRVSLSTKHTLALTNRGGATTAELLTLAREVRDGVEAAFGVRLVNEPVTVGCSL